MLKKTLLLAAVAAVAALPAAAEPLNYNVIEFSESAHAEVTQDTMIVSLRIQQEGRDRAEVNRAFMQKYNSLNRLISANRALKSELQGRSATPRYQYKNGKQTQIGWQENARIRVESSDFAALNKLIADAQDHASLQHTYFTLSKQKREAAVDEVSKAALKRFQSRADSLAQTLGFRGYKIVKLDLGQIGNQAAYVGAPEAAAPMMLRSMKADGVGAQPEVTQPGTEEVRITVQGTIQL